MRRYALILVALGLLLSACLPKTPAPPTVTSTVAAATTAAPTDTSAPTDTPAPSDTPAPTDTTAPVATTAVATTAPSDTPAPSVTTAASTSTTAPSAAPSQTAPAGPTLTPAPLAYLDDRSTAAEVMSSFVNALSLKQYVRAYSYWEVGAPQLAPYAQFAAGYANTQSTQLTLGTITSSGAAGSIYFNTPATLLVQTTGGTQTFVGCYILRLPQPANFSAPPVHPMAINQAHVQQVANNANAASLMAQACNNFPGTPLTPTPVPDPNDISSARYLDDRSDAIQVLRSLYNAINRKEYARAYGYWQTNAQGLPPFNQFQQGYATTASVTTTFGTVTGDAGAGQRYWKVPTTLVSTLTNSTIQTYVGCYTLHLSVPEIQGVPPFQPMAIMAGALQLVANTANTATLMTQACH